MGRSTFHGVVTAMNYAIQYTNRDNTISVLGINFMNAYAVYQLTRATTQFDKQIIVQHVCTDASR